MAYNLKSLMTNYSSSANVRGNMTILLVAFRLPRRAMPLGYQLPTLLKMYSLKLTHKLVVLILVSLMVPLHLLVRETFNNLTLPTVLRAQDKQTPQLTTLQALCFFLLLI